MFCMIIIKLICEMLWWDSVLGLKKEEDFFVLSKSEDMIVLWDLFFKVNGKKIKECKGILFKCLVGYFLRLFFFYLIKSIS